MSIVCEISGQERRKDGGKIPSRPREIPMQRRSLRTPERFRSAAHRLPATPGLVHYWKSFSFSHKSRGPEPRALLFSPCQAEGLCFMSHCVLNTRRNLGKWLTQPDEVQYFILIFTIIVIIIVNFFLCVKSRKGIHIYADAFCTSWCSTRGGKTRALVSRWRCEPNIEAHFFRESCPFDTLLNAKRRNPRRSPSRLGGLICSTRGCVYSSWESGISASVRRRGARAETRTGAQAAAYYFPSLRNPDAHIKAVKPASRTTRDSIYLFIYFTEKRLVPKQ